MTYLLVDGYNVIFSWERLGALARENMDGARAALQNILCNYQGYRQYCVILVFDGYRVKGNAGVTAPYHNITVVYTKEAMTADQYIEQAAGALVKEAHDVRVVTSDALEQVIVMAKGARRISVRDFDAEIRQMEREIEEEITKKTGAQRNFLFSGLSGELADTIERMRLNPKQGEEK